MNRLVALARMQQSGVFLSTSEVLILQLVKDAAHPQFKEVRPPLSPRHRRQASRPLVIFIFTLSLSYYVFPVCMYVLCMYVCMYVHHLCAWCLGALKGQKRVLDFLNRSYRQL